MAAWSCEAPFLKPQRPSLDLSIIGVSKSAFKKLALAHSSRCYVVTYQRPESDPGIQTLKAVCVLLIDFSILIGGCINSL